MSRKYFSCHRHFKDFALLVLELQYKERSETHLGAVVFLQLNMAMLANRTIQ